MSDNKFFRIQGAYNDAIRDNAYWNIENGWVKKTHSTRFPISDLYSIDIPKGTTGIKDEHGFSSSVVDAYINFKPVEITPEIYARLEYAYFKKSEIPVEFQSAISHLAYEIGHAYGYHEILIHLIDFIDTLELPIKKYADKVYKSAFPTA